MTPETLAEITELIIKNATPATREEGYERLLALARYAEKHIPEKQFDYRSWIGKDWKGKPDLSCGTTACMLGWATTMPEFKELGLKLHKERHEVSGRVVLEKLGVFAKKNPYDAAMVVFGLTYQEADYLFTPVDDEEVATPRQVARKIRKWVKAQREMKGHDK